MPLIARLLLGKNFFLTLRDSLNVSLTYFAQPMCSSNRISGMLNVQFEHRIKSRNEI